MKHLRKRLRLIAFTLFCLFCTFTALQHKVYAGTVSSSQVTSKISGEVSQHYICSPASFAALGQSVAAGVALVVGAYQLGRAVGEFVYNYQHRHRRPRLEKALEIAKSQYNSTDFSKFDI